MNPTAALIYAQAEAVKAGADPDTAVRRIHSHIAGIERLDLDTLAACQILDSGAAFLRATGHSKAADELAYAVDVMADYGIVPQSWYFGWLGLFAKAAPTVPVERADDFAKAVADRLAGTLSVHIASEPRRVIRQRVIRDSHGVITETIAVQEDADLSA